MFITVSCTIQAPGPWSRFRLKSKFVHCLVIEYIEKKEKNEKENDFKMCLYITLMVTNLSVILWCTSIIILWMINWNLDLV